MGIRQQAVQNGVAQFTTRQHSYVGSNGETKTIDVLVPVMTGDAFEPKLAQNAAPKIVSFEDAKTATEKLLSQIKAENAVKNISQIEELRAFNNIGKANASLDRVVGQVKLAFSDQQHDGSSQLTQSAVVRDKNNGIV